MPDPLLQLRDGADPDKAARILLEELSLAGGEQLQLGLPPGDTRPG